MRTETLVLALILALAGCATGPAGRGTATVQGPPAPVASTVGACTPPAGPVARPDLCRYPADVRAFVADRDACDHLRSEPWPEGDSADDRARRRLLVESVRTQCAGTDHQLAALKERYTADASVLLLLSTFDERIGN